MFLFSSIEGASLKLVKEIGSDDDDYLFIRLHGAVLSKNKDIYLLDCMGNSLARYDWNGKFIKKIGQRGQGPGDFNMPCHLNLLDDKLYFFDVLNNRIAEVDLELNDIKYHNLLGAASFTKKFFMIGKNKCVGNTLFFLEESGSQYKWLKILDFDTMQSRNFFEHVPIPVDSKKIKKSHMMILNCMPAIGVNQKTKKIVVSFMNPNNPIDFFVYDFAGECLEKFSYTFDKNYRYPDFMLKGEKPPQKYTKIMVNSLFFHKGYYVFLVCKTKMDGRKENFKFNRDGHFKGQYNFKSKRHFLIFDETGKELKHKIPAPDYLEAFSLSEDGYLLGTRNFEDTVKLCIYKLEI